MERLAIETKTANQGASSAGKLTAHEFNKLVQKVNEMIDSLNKTVYLTQTEYDALVSGSLVRSDVEYNIYEEQ